VYALWISFSDIKTCLQAADMEDYDFLSWQQALNLLDFLSFPEGAERGESHMGLFIVQGIQAVIIIHIGMQDGKAVRTKAQLAAKQFHNSGFLAAYDQAAGVKKVIHLPDRGISGKKGDIHDPGKWLICLERAAAVWYL